MWTLFLRLYKTYFFSIFFSNLIFTKLVNINRKLNGILNEKNYFKLYFVCFNATWKVINPLFEIFRLSLFDAKRIIELSKYISMRRNYFSFFIETRNNLFLFTIQLKKFQHANKSVLYESFESFEKSTFFLTFVIAEFSCR